MMDGILPALLGRRGIALISEAGRKQKQVEGEPSPSEVKALEEMHVVQVKPQSYAMTLATLSLGLIRWKTAQFPWQVA